jgi:hypothetical protein
VVDRSPYIQCSLTLPFSSQMATIKTKHLHQHTQRTLLCHLAASPKPIKDNRFYRLFRNVLVKAQEKLSVESCQFRVRQSIRPKDVLIYNSPVRYFSERQLMVRRTTRSTINRICRHRGLVVICH